MNKIIHVSKFKNHLLAKKGKVSLANIADYFITFILCFFLFIAIGQPIAYGASESTLNNISATSERLYEIVDETRLGKLNKSTNKLTDEETLANEYIITLIKTSYYLNNEQYPYFKDDGTYFNKNVDINETFLNIGIQNEHGNYSFPNNNLEYYFLTFKKEHESLNFYIYDDVDYLNNEEQYLFENILDYQNEAFKDYFIFIDNSYSKYIQLDIKIAKYLVQYLSFNDESESIYKYYLYLKNSYINALNKLINEMNLKYTPYVETNKLFDSYYLNFTLTYLGSLLICYFISLLILELVVPLISKNNSTLSYIIFKIALATKDEDEPKIYQRIIRSFIRFLMYVSSTVLVLFFIGNYQMISFPLIGEFSFLTICFMSLIIALCSLLFVFISKKNQGFSETLSLLIVKDTTMLENISGETIINGK